MSYLAAKRLTARKENTVSLFASFWLMTGLKGSEWGSTRGHPGEVASRPVRHNKHSQNAREAFHPRRKITYMKTITQIAVVTLAVAASTLLVWSEPGENQTPTIEGVWQVSRVGVNCNDPNQELGSPFPAIMTFHQDGIVSGAAKSPVTGPFDTPEHGLWKREPGSQNYSFRELSYKYDSNGAFLGPLVLTANVELTSANSFIYNATIQIFDANGNLSSSRCGRATATRF